MGTMATTGGSLETGLPLCFATGDALAIRSVMSAPIRREVTNLITLTPPAGRMKVTVGPGLGTGTAPDHSDGCALLI